MNIPAYYYEVWELKKDMGKAITEYCRAKNYRLVSHSQEGTVVTLIFQLML